MIPRRKVGRSQSTQIEELPPIDASEQKKFLRKKRQLLGPDVIAKYEKWFVAMDANDNGLVSMDELSRVFLSSGIMKRNIDIINMFKACDIDKSNELNFDEFILAIKPYAMSGKLRLDKLDALVENANSLTTETVLSQQRRNLLMHHIVTAAELRQYEVDQWAMSQLQAKQKGNLTIAKNKKSIETLSKLHQKHMKRAENIVLTLYPIVRQTSNDLSEKGLGRPCLRSQLSLNSIQDIEALMAPSLSKSKHDIHLLADMEDILEADTSHDAKPVSSSVHPCESTIALSPVPTAIRKCPQGLIKDGEKLLLSEKGLVVNLSMSEGALGKYPQRSKSGTSNHKQLSFINTRTNKSTSRTHLRPLVSINTSPISTPAHSSWSSSSIQQGKLDCSMFYESQQNRYSIRRYELPK